MKLISSPSVASILALAALAGCGQTTAEGPDKAQAAAETGVTASPDAPIATAEAVDGNTYRIASYGITIAAPEGWHVVDTGVMDKLIDAAQDVTTADMNSAMKAAVAGSVQRTTTLFTFMEVPPGSPREYIPALMGLAEDVSMLPGVKRGSDYLFHVRNLMSQSAVPTLAADGYSERTIDGQVFDWMDVEMSLGNVELLQRYFAARHGDHVIAMIQAYRTDEELAVLDRALDSIKLDW